MTKLKGTKLCLAEALFEIINGLHGSRDAEHDKYERDAKNYLKRLTKNKNISIDYDKKIIEIQDTDGTKTLYTITIN